MNCGECKDSKWSIFLSEISDMDKVINIMVNKIGYTKFQSKLLINEVYTNGSISIFTGTHEECIRISTYFTSQLINISIRKNIY